MRHWHLLHLSVFIFVSAVAARNRALKEFENSGVSDSTFFEPFDAASTAQLDSAFLSELDGATGHDTAVTHVALNFSQSPTPSPAHVLRRSLAEVNQEAPVYKMPTSNGTVLGKPVASQRLSVSPRSSVGIKDGQDRGNREKSGKVHSFQVTNTQIPVFGVGGTTLEYLMGIRISLPFFGSGFNLCIDRFVGSFPKVGIVIPNPVAWLIPEFSDLAHNLQTTLDVPVPGDGAPLGSRIAPTSDGFVIWLPSAVQPLTLPEFGFRYGLQVSQLFGMDFGFGWLRSSCAIDFVRV
eukprot:jgi/Botrbrau1/16739/Bobra.0271s0004.1